GRSQGDGSQLIQTYKDLGLILNRANNDVEGGIQLVWQRIASGKLKVFSSLHNFAKEYVLYRRDDRGKVMKENDHLMDALRYLVIELGKAKSINQIISTPKYTGPTRYRI